MIGKCGRGDIRRFGMKKYLWILLVVVLAITVAGCGAAEGAQGPAGAEGAAGPAGPAGAEGPAGKVLRALQTNETQPRTR